MPDPCATSPGPLAPSPHLIEAIEAANTLLYHAIASGRDVPAAVRDPIIKARASIGRDEPLSGADEGAFLDAYARLALRVAPVSASTLEFTRQNHSRHGRLARWLRLAPVSDAQRLAWHFGLLALALIVAIGMGEWARTFIGAIATAERQISANVRDIREAETRQEGFEKQIDMLAHDSRTTDSANLGAVREGLDTRRDEVRGRIWALRQANWELEQTVTGGYATLSRLFVLFDREGLQHVSVPVANVLGGLLLPILYGALGTCAFILRSLYREMAERTFDGRRVGEFRVRVFLGMVSGVAIQWIFVKPDVAVTAGATPAVLAFVGGYSVEMLFAAMDRLVNAVAGRMRPAHRAPAAGPARPDRPGRNGLAPKRGRAHEVSSNGNGAAHADKRPPAPPALPAGSLTR